MTRGTNIEMKILSLNSHKACGADEVKSHVSKACASAFSKPLKIIFRKSVIEGYVPKLWKEANVTPIHKERQQNFSCQL